VPTQPLPSQELSLTAIENYAAANRNRRANLVRRDLAALFLYAVESFMAW
jgi:hypothetical protein